MSGGLLHPSAWVAPFGFLKDERESEAKVAQGFEEDLVGLVVTYVVIIIFDIVTLPLAILWALGIGRETDPSDSDR
jgi:hypothetical protein